MISKLLVLGEFYHWMVVCTLLLEEFLIAAVFASAKSYTLICPKKIKAEVVLAGYSNILLFLNLLEMILYYKNGGGSHLLDSSYFVVNVVESSD